MSKISILNLHYQLLELFREFLKSPTDFPSPYLLLQSRSPHQLLSSSLDSYSKQSIEISLIREFFYLKNFSLEKLKFFLFFRDLILSLRPARQTDFLENISLDLQKWPKIITGLCAWDRKFAENMTELCSKVEELNKSKRGRFAQANNSINSINLLEVCLNMIEEVRGEVKKKKTDKIRGQSISWILESPNNKLNYDSKIFANSKVRKSSNERKSDVGGIEAVMFKAEARDEIQEPGLDEEGKNSRLADIKRNFEIIEKQDRSMLSYRKFEFKQESSPNDEGTESDEFGKKEKLSVSFVEAEQKLIHDFRSSSSGKRESENSKEPSNSDFIKGEKRPIKNKVLPEKQEHGTKIQKDSQSSFEDSQSKAKPNHQKEQPFIRPPKAYYKNLLRGCSTQDSN